jgi:hypothetical protein
MTDKTQCVVWGSEVEAILVYIGHRSWSQMKRGDDASAPRVLVEEGCERARSLCPLQKFALPLNAWLKCRHLCADERMHFSYKSKIAC